MCSRGVTSLLSQCHPCLIETSKEVHIWVMWFIIFFFTCRFECIVLSSWKMMDFNMDSFLCSGCQCRSCVCFWASCGDWLTAFHHHLKLHKYKKVPLLSGLLLWSPCSPYVLTFCFISLETLIHTDVTLKILPQSNLYLNSKRSEEQHLTMMCYYLQYCC